MNTNSTNSLDLPSLESEEIEYAPSSGNLIEFEPVDLPQGFLSSSGTDGHTDEEDITSDTGVYQEDITPPSLHLSDLVGVAEGRRRKTMSRKPKTKRHYNKRRSHKKKPSKKKPSKTKHSKKRTYKRRCNCSKKKRSPRGKYSRRK